MQSKMIMQTLLRIFTVSKYDLAVASLKSFLPQTMDNFGFAVLSPKLAQGLMLCHFMAHYSDEKPLVQCGNESLCLEKVLGVISSILTCQTLQSYHRPITRLSSMTMFKRFLQECHQIVVAKKVDEDAQGKAEELDKLIKKFASDYKTVNLAADTCADDFDFQKLHDLLKDVVDS